MQHYLNVIHFIKSLSIGDIMIQLGPGFPYKTVLFTKGFISFVFSMEGNTSAMEVVKGIYYDTMLNLHYPEGMYLTKVTFCISNESNYF